MFYGLTACDLLSDSFDVLAYLHKFKILFCEFKSHKRIRVGCIQTVKRYAMKSINDQFPQILFHDNAKENMKLTFMTNQKQDWPSCCLNYYRQRRFGGYIYANRDFQTKFRLAKIKPSIVIGIPSSIHLKWVHQSVHQVGAPIFWVRSLTNKLVRTSTCYT